MFIRPFFRQPSVLPGVLQDSFSVVDNDGTERTLGQLLTWMFPAAAPTSVVLHGISPPLDTPLQWLCEHGCYPDAFLHLVVRF
jgi:autophagy-related protein 5